ncbi:hypothetical protein AMECASPLE_024891 [Ameca splendens]|uniref:Uncharacterized protein n=1 Tax=Ameca splendens TaxID=208324 RepID=A0ABV0YRF3_9TELE
MVKITRYCHKRIGRQRRWINFIEGSKIHQMIQGLGFGILEQLRPIKYLQQGCKNNLLCCVRKEGETLWCVTSFYRPDLVSVQKEASRHSSPLTMDRSGQELFLNFMIVLITVLLMWILVKTYQD